jgi:predicted Na+-dependent transporter
MMLDGNLDLAVAMSFVASVSALGIQPFWLFTLGRVFYGGRVTIPYTTITGSLFGLICPIFFGLAFKHFLPRWAERIGRILKPVTVVSFIIVGIFGIGVNSYVFALLDWRHFVCGMLVPYAGYFLTYPCARFLLRRTHEDSLAIAIENGCLNVAVPVVLLQLSLTQPDADLSLVVPVGMVICASWPLWIYFVYKIIKKRFAGSEKTEEKSIEAPVNVMSAAVVKLEKDAEKSQVSSTTEMTTAASSSTISELSAPIDESLSKKPTSDQSRDVHV